MFSRKEVEEALQRTYKDVNRNHTLALAAGLSYYYLLSLFPLLIFLAALLGYIPIPHLFDQLLTLMARIVPADAMGAVREILKGVLTPPRGGLLSFGFITTIWAATGGFSALIEALNIAYDVCETRAYWRTRLLAVGLTFMVGALGVVALGVTALGPRFGDWLVNHSSLDHIWQVGWPIIYWGLLILCAVLTVELLYFLAPNVKQDFFATLPGALLAVGIWVLSYHALGIYFRNFANFSRTYGTLGGIIALMLWFYVTTFILLVGGELNSELLKACGERLRVKKPTADVKAQGDLIPEQKKELVNKLVEAEKPKLPQRAA